jgi:hypothetical protein
LVEPDLVVSWTEVAVMVTCVVKGTVDAVKVAVEVPVDATVPPPLAAHVTAELKVPVPVIVAVH